MRNISRRTALKGGTATVAVIAAGGAVAARVAIDEPVIALERQWKAMQAEMKRCSNFWCQQYDSMPAWARAGPDGKSKGHTPGWPDISDLPAFKGATGPEQLGKRPRLAEVRAFNLLVEDRARDYPGRLAEVKVEGRARVRAWIGRYRQVEDIERALGIHDWDNQMEPHHDRMSEVEQQMIDTPALTAEGIAVKLRFWNYIEGPRSESSAGVGEGFALSALRDAERLAGRAER
jgi:hypothetical protein